MSIALSNDLFTDFDVVENLEDTINNKKLVLNNNLIIDKDFINKGDLAIRGKIIFRGGKLINLGNIYLIEKQRIEHTLLFDITGDNVFTGLTVDRNIKELILIVTGPNFRFNGVKSILKFSKGKQSPFYFSNDNGLTSKKNIEIGDELYWNSSQSKIKLFSTLKITLVVL